MFNLFKNIFKKREQPKEETYIGDEFYSVMKLVSGEEILSLVIFDDNDGEPIAILQNPLTLKIIHNSQGSFIKVKPWIEMSNEDIFIMKMDKIITMTEVKDEKLIQVYNNYNKDDEDDSIDFYTPSGKVKLSSSMGYVSSVEDARKKLEELYKS